MGFNECENNRYLKPFPSYLLMLVSILPIGTQIHQSMSRLCAEINSMSEQTVRWRRWCVWWKVGMNYGQMRWREEQPTCHVSLGWGREADDDVRFHPSVRFWRGICHHGWANAKNNSFNFVCDEARASVLVGRAGWHVPHGLWQESYPRPPHAGLCSFSQCW